MLLISFWKFFVFSNCFSLPYYANMWLSLKAQSSSLLFSIHLAFIHLFDFLISAIYRVYTYSNICHHCKNQTNLQTESFPHTFFHYSSKVHTNIPQKHNSEKGIIPLQHHTSIIHEYEWYHHNLFPGPKLTKVQFCFRMKEYKQWAIYALKYLK